MDPVCHRCGENLVPDELYCPHCGAPQLRVEESEAVTSAQEGSIQLSLDRVADMMRWRAAVSAALLVAIPVALLSDLLSLGALWVFAGGFVAVSLYRRRTAAPTNGRIGWRIGGLMGFIAAFFWLAFEAISMLIERYVMHQGAAIDSALSSAMKKALDTVNKQNPSLAHQIPWFAQFWLSPSGLATIFLIQTTFLALAMILFSALGGAIGGTYQRNRPPQSGAA